MKKGKILHGATATTMAKAATQTSTPQLRRIAFAYEHSTTSVGALLRRICKLEIARRGETL